MEEIWKKVNLKFLEDIVTKNVIEISNWGRVRTTNSLHKGKIIKGGLVDGYLVYKTNFYTPRQESVQKKFDKVKKEIIKLERSKKLLISEGSNTKNLSEIETTLSKSKKKLSAAMKKDLKSRAVLFQKLIHRMVAENFLPKPNKKQIYVAHLDFNKLNNQASNLKWMTQEENTQHHVKNPKNILKKEKNITPRGNAKLKETEVMYIKKLLVNGKSLKEIAKNFKVSDMQIHRIKTGENWKNIQTAS
jgi:hypothetical protein